MIIVKEHMLNSMKIVSMKVTVFICTITLDGNYHYIEIYDMDGYDDGDEIEIYDYENGEYR